MIFRSLVTGALLAAIYSLLLLVLLGNPALWQNFLIFWSLGFFSILSFVYGRKVKRAFKSETGKIKWFDPSKGYGFLIRDKGGDLFVHLRSVKPEDRRKLRENTRVRFTVEETEKGPQAEKIRII
tara:strand:+ start:297 stop:671 length:375 start_codon:yes stop_codon:yes gene_type:complete